MTEGKYGFEGSSGPSGFHPSMGRSHGESPIGPRRPDPIARGGSDKSPPVDGNTGFDEAGEPQDPRTELGNVLRDLRWVRYNAIFIQYYTERATPNDVAPEDTLTSRVNALYTIWGADRDFAQDEMSNEQMGAVVQNLRPIRDRWKEKGLIQDPDMPQEQRLADSSGLSVRELEKVEFNSIIGFEPKTETHEEHKRDLVGQIRMMAHEVEEYEALHATYSPSDTRSFQEPALGEIADLLERHREDPETGKKDITDPQFLDALESCVDRLRIDYTLDGVLPAPPHIAAALARRDRQRAPDDIDHDIDNVDVEGVEPPEGEIAVFLLPDIRKILEWMPDDSIKNLKSISFKEPPEDVPGASGSIDGNVDDKGNFTCEIEIYIPNHYPMTVGSEEFKAATYSIEPELSHWLGMAAAYNLDIEDMRGWEDVVAEDSEIAVSPAVREKYEESEAAGKRWDFAGTFSAFLYRPGLLQIVSESRFQFMTDYFKRHVDPREWDALWRWVQNNAAWQQEDYRANKTDEEIRNEYRK